MLATIAFRNGVMRNTGIAQARLQIGFWTALACMSVNLPAQTMNSVGRGLETLEQAERVRQAARAAARERAAREAAEAEAAARASAQSAVPAAPALEQEVQGMPWLSTRTVSLIVRSDHPCRLSIDTVYRRDLRAGEAFTLQLEPGDQLIECESMQYPGVHVSEIKTLTEGSKAAVLLDFSTQLAARETTGSTTAASTGMAPPASPAGTPAGFNDWPQGPASDNPAMPPQAPPPSRFEAHADGILDRDQGLIWAASDSVANIDWPRAKGLCASRGTGWSLPTSVQLQSLRGSSSPTQLTSGWYWSAEANGPSEAFGIFIADGFRHPFPISSSDRKRALCVRRA